jgi:hypothetical protein
MSNDTLHLSLGSHDEDGNHGSLPTEPLLSRMSEQPIDKVDPVLENPEQFQLPHRQSSFFGFLLGMVVQTTRLAACALITTRGDSSSPSGHSDQVLLGLLVVLSQLDIIMFAGVVIIFALILFQPGTSYCLPWSKADETNASTCIRIWTTKRLFYTTCTVYGGVIGGSYLFSMAINTTLGTPLPLFPMFLAGATNLTLFCFCIPRLQEEGSSETKMANNDDNDRLIDV